MKTRAPASYMAFNSLTHSTGAATCFAKISRMALGSLGYGVASTFVKTMRTGVLTVRRSSTLRSGALAGATMLVWNAAETGRSIVSTPFCCASSTAFFTLGVSPATTVCTGQFLFAATT